MSPLLLSLGALAVTQIPGQTLPEVETNVLRRAEAVRKHAAWIEIAVRAEERGEEIYRTVVGVNPGTDQILLSPAVERQIALRRQQIEKQRDEILEELRQGAYCSKCGKSRSELGGEIAFRNHIQQVSADVRQATPEQITAAEKRFSKEIAHIEELRSAFIQVTSNREVAASRAEFYVNEWSRNVDQEETTRSRRWMTLVRQKSQKLTLKRKQYLGLLSMIQRAEVNSAAQTTLRRLAGTVKREYNQIASSLKVEHIRQNNIRESFREEVKDQHLHLLRQAQRLSSNFMIDGRQYVQAIRTMRIPVADGKLPLPVVNPL